MPSRIDDDCLFLSGVVSIEEAEPIRDLLACHPRASVDLSECEHLHTAALQVILMARPAVVSSPKDAFLARWIFPKAASDAASNPWSLAETGAN